MKLSPSPLSGGTNIFDSAARSRKFHPPATKIASESHGGRSRIGAPQAASPVTERPVRPRAVGASLVCVMILSGCRSTSLLYRHGCASIGFPAGDAADVLGRDADAADRSTRVGLRSDKRRSDKHGGAKSDGDTHGDPLPRRPYHIRRGHRSDPSDGQRGDLIPHPIRWRPRIIISSGCSLHLPVNFSGANGLVPETTRGKSK